MKPHRNLIGPQIRKLRYKMGWSQDQLAAKLQIAGLDISRSALAKIESGWQTVPDFQACYFMNVFKVDYLDLVPLRFNPHRSDFHDQLTDYLCTDNRKQRNQSD